MKTLVTILLLALFAVPALAETYTWMDDQGTVNFADDLGQVPKKYRKRAKVLGGEETPPADQEGQEKSAVQPQKGAAQAEKEAAPAVQKAVYGGKDAAAWKYEFGAARANLKAAEDQLVDSRNRLKDTSGMSRGEYLNIQSTIKSLEYSVQRQRKQMEELKKQAEGVGVPAELME